MEIKNGEQNLSKKKFYQANWLLWILLIFLPPAGIILLWIYHKDKSIRTKIVLSAIFIIWFIAVLIIGEQKQPLNKAISLNSDSYQAQIDKKDESVSQIKSDDLEKNKNSELTKSNNSKEIENTTPDSV